MIKRYFQYILIPLILIAISLPIILPYFHTGYFPTHDGEWAVVRLGDMFRSLRDHQFPVRFSVYLNFGYGYPLFNFVYPAPYYIGILFHFFKIGFVDCIKLLFAVSVVLSSVTMYVASYELWRNKTAAIISSIFYIYLPYRIVDLYARGSIGESLSFALFPLIVFFILKILDNASSKMYCILGSISYALLIMTHNIMAVLFTPILLIFIVFKMYFAKSKKYLDILIFILLSYGLSAFFWIPAILEKHNILLSKIPIADREIYFVNIKQLLVPIWGYGLPDHADGFSYQIGLGHITILLLVFFTLLYFWLTKKKVFNEFKFRLSAMFVIMTFLLVVLMFPIMTTIWQATPFLKEINYPWTLLAPIGFILSLLPGFLWLQNKFMKYIVLALCVLTVIMVLPHAKPVGFIDKGDNYYITNDATTTSSQELMPLWVKEKPSKRAEKKVEIVKGAGAIKNINYNSKRISFSVDLKKNSLVQVNTVYWPGWNAYVDGKKVDIIYNNPGGVMQLSIPSGNHKVILKFEETPIRLLADIISLISLLILMFIIYVKHFVIPGRKPGIYFTSGFPRARE